MNQRNQHFVHLVWATWDREPWIDPRCEVVVLRAIHDQASQRRSRVLGINTAVDHVHVLVQLHPMIGIGALVRAMKATSSWHVRTSGRNPTFRWQGGYAAIAVAPETVSSVKQYIDDQKIHHQTNDRIGELDEVERSQST